LFDANEHVRHDATVEDFTGLRPVFKRDGCPVVLASEAAVGRLGLKPMARPIGYGHAGVEPQYMGLGPIPATRLAVKKTGVEVDKIDVIESNEAFAAPASAVARELGFVAAKINPNGSSTRWVIRLAPPALSIRSRRFVSLPAPASVTRWSQCASAEVRESPRY
jgi:acetyl-CoA C-acetyltransferase